MAKTDLARAVAAEFLGSLLLVATVVGSGIMGESLAGGNSAIALLANSLATGAILVGLIGVFAPISGAHFNPAVSLVFALRRELRFEHLPAYVGAQVIGAVLGTFLAHLMFALPVLQFSDRLRQGPSQLISEIVAAFGLIVTILGCQRHRPQFVPMAVALYIVAGYWFTASTCFANPAVAIARSLTDTFAGIRPADVPLFVLAEFVGAGIAALVCGWLFAAQAGAKVAAEEGAPGRSGERPPDAA